MITEPLCLVNITSREKRGQRHRVLVNVIHIEFMFPFLFCCSYHAESQVFGCVAFIHVHKQHHCKLDACAV